MPKDETKLNLIPNLLNTLADIIEEVADAADFWNSVKISTFVSLARNSAENFDVETTLSSDELEQDFANLMEGGTFSMDLSFDRSKFYVEFADEWTGHIKKIFAAETFAGVIKAVSDKKDEADLIFQMSKKPIIDVNAETANEAPEEEGGADLVKELSEEVAQNLWGPNEHRHVSEAGEVEEAEKDVKEVRDATQKKTCEAIKINTIVPDTEESIKRNTEEHRAQVKAMEGKEYEGLTALPADHPLRLDVQQTSSSLLRREQDAAPEPSDLFPGKEPTRNNFFGPSKKDELPGQKTFPFDPKTPQN